MTKPGAAAAWRRRFARAALAAAVTAGLVEGGVRLVPRVAGDPLRSLVEEAGRIPLSNTRVFGGFAGGTRRLLPPPAPADVLVVGDSMAFGTYVRESDTFAARLSAATGLRTVNLAVGSQAPPAYNRMLELGMRYRPRLALYCVFANDFRYAAPPVIRDPLSAAGQLGALPGDQELYVIALDGTEQVAAAIKRLTNLSRAYQLVKILRQPASSNAPVTWAHDGIRFMFAPVEYWDPQLAWSDPGVRDGLEIDVRLITAADRLAASRGVRLAVVLLPSKEMVYGPAVGARIYRDDHHRTYRELAARLTDAGIEAWDLTDVLRRAGASAKLYHTVDGHLNEEGHRQVAAWLAGMVGGRPH